jgi:hypothetical protein
MKEENKYHGWENGWMKSIQRSNFALTDKEIDSLIDWGNTIPKNKPNEIKEEITNDYQYILIAR